MDGTSKFYELLTPHLTFRFLVLRIWNGNICFLSRSHATDSVSMMNDVTSLLTYKGLCTVSFVILLVDNIVIVSLCEEGVQKDRAENWSKSPTDTPPPTPTLHSPYPPKKEQKRKKKEMEIEIWREKGPIPNIFVYV